MTEDKTTRWGDNVIIADFAGRRRRKQSSAEVAGTQPSGSVSNARPKGGKTGVAGARGQQEHGFRESWVARVLMQQLVNKTDSGRVARGREYFRAGKVHDLAFDTDSAAALVAGSQLQPFDVQLVLPPLSEKQRAGVLGEVLRESTEVHALAAGNRPGEAVVAGLLGHSTGDEQFAGLRTWCDCPDREDVCKHVVAVGLAVCEYLSEVPLRILSWRGIDTEPVTRLMQYMQVPATVTPLDGKGSGTEQWRGAGTGGDDAGHEQPDIVDPKEFWGAPEHRVRWQVPKTEWGLDSGEREQLEKAVRTVTWNTVDQLNTMSELERCYESLIEAEPVFDYGHAWGEAMSDDDGKD